MPDTDTQEASAVLDVLHRIATGQEQSISTQRELNETTKANTLSIQEMTIAFERYRGEAATRFQKNEDRLDAVEHRQDEYDEEQKATEKRRWAVVMAGLGAVATWLGSHWPFHLSPPPHGR